MLAAPVPGPAVGHLPTTPFPSALPAPAASILATLPGPAPAPAPASADTGGDVVGIVIISLVNGSIVLVMAVGMCLTVATAIWKCCQRRSQIARAALAKRRTTIPVEDLEAAHVIESP